MWLSVIQTQQREHVGVCLCLCMSVCTCVSQCAWLHAQVCVCVCVSVYESDCVCNVSHAASLCVYNTELTAGAAEIFSFSAFRSLWKQSNWTTAAGTIANRYLSPRAMVSPWIPYSWSPQGTMHTYQHGNVFSKHQYLCISICYSIHQIKSCLGWWCLRASWGVLVAWGWGCWLCGYDRPLGSSLKKL